MFKIEFMQRALNLAKRGAPLVSPNPMVGCVIAKNGKIIGEGYHEFFGGPHAEINAFNNCNESPEKSDIYVTLEPCSHYGKTPPCAERIVKEKVKNVYIALKDPNKLVSGRGIEILKSAGINVQCGFLEKQAKEQNKYFLHYIKNEMPYVILKSAITLDGFIADKYGKSNWISSEDSRKDVHILRSKVDAILVGAGTVKADNPMLNVRLVKGRNPKKIVFDYKGDLNGEYKLFDENTVYVVLKSKSNNKFLKYLEKKKTKIIFVENFNIAEILKEFAKMKIASILVEGGAYTSGLFLESGFINELILYQAPIVLGEGINLFKLNKNRTIEEKIVLGIQDTKTCLQGLWKKQVY